MFSYIDICSPDINVYCEIMQGHHFSLLQHETEKLRNDIEKMRSELRSDLLVKIEYCLLPCDYLFALSENPCINHNYSDVGMKLIKLLQGSGSI